MSFVPLMKYSSKKTMQQIVTFGGVRYGRGGSDGDFSETENLSDRQFPALSQRRGRKLHKEYENATALYCRTKLIVIDGTNVIYDGETVGQVTAGEKMITSVNTKIVIFPDKKYYDTEKKKFGDMEVSLDVEAKDINWGDSIVSISGLSQPLSEIFAVGQAIEFSGSGKEDNNKTAVITEISDTYNQLDFAPNTFTEYGEEKTVTIKRKIPAFTCICESANRLWGAEGKTIYASALGDPLTFYNYSGLSTDSFAVAVGTDGEFTACIGYSSNVLFWKENALHKVLGSAPSEYRVYDYTVPGVQKGSAKSMAIINEVLYYKSSAGVYAYSGASPALISENFGTRRYKGANAGTDGMKYYISMQEDSADGPWSLFVFNPETGIWLREDATHVVDFARFESTLYALFAENKDVYILDQETNEKLPWEAIFYPFDDTIYGKRGYSKLWMKLEISPGDWVQAQISSDGGPFRPAGRWSDKEKQSILAPIFPGRCDTFRLKLSGVGDCVIKSLVREFVVDSDK